MNTPYGDGGGFTPYEPAGTAVSEEPAPAVPTRHTGRAVAIIIGIAIAVAGIGTGAVIAFVAVVGSDGDGGSEELFANDLEAGQCLIGAGLDLTNDDPVSDMEVVDCATSHDAEVLAANVLDREEAASYDMDREGQADEYCRDFFSPEQKALLRQDAYGLLALTELAEPETGDKVACLLVDADGDPLRGSHG
ncbi:hypothetical protein HNR19_001278 [Nocardioides thalensis]|uniref:Septum formation-related domain-containing protein n=1 Tax=Nocardioides thalensis TaxID=1914755 RepID=A0A853BXD2_9ACTN|nr:hypothetical protein [Nocardioides thalensis]NYJ00580.1 hypothetical protein [Nocardioides thalensis]